MNMMIVPNYRDWYWQVASVGKVYASARIAYVAADDTAFAAWRATGRAPTQIASEADLWGVVHPLMPDLTPDWLFDGVTFVPPAAGAYSKAQLKAYAAARRYAVEVGGLTIDAKPIATDRASQAMIAGAYNYVAASPSAVIQYKTETGFVELTAAEITAIATAVGAHVQMCFAKEAEVAAAIDAATVVALAEIDAAFAAL